MGLDIYLYHCPDRATAQAAEKQVEEYSEELWKEINGEKEEYEKLSQEKKDQNYKVYEARKKAFAAPLGCTGEYESHASVTSIREDSKLYPEHMFKIGYFRSSYNDGGIENVLRQFDIPGLHEIFNYTTEYEFTPDWKNSLSVVKQSIKKYEKHLNGPTGNFSVMRIAENMFVSGSGPRNEKEAMEIVEKELAKSNIPNGGGYSNREGHYFWEGIEAVAFIPGVEKILGSRSCVYVVYKKQKEKESSLEERERSIQQVTDKLDKKEKDWYLQALEVTKETIEYVLSQKDPQNYYLCWSG